MTLPEPAALLAFVKREMTLVAALFAAALGVLAFVGIADEMREGDARAFDEALLLAMRTGDAHDPIGPMWFEFAVRDLTALGGYAVLTLVTLVAVGYLIVTKKYADALLLAIAAIGAQVLSEALKSVFARPRPDLVAHIVETASASFPSGHATVSAAIYLTIGALLARVQTRRRLKTYIHAAALLITLLIGISRVYLGVHWPTDVLAGWCVGGAWSILCLAIASWLTREDRAKVAA